MGKDNIRTKYYELLDEFDQYKIKSKNDIAKLIDQNNIQASKCQRLEIQLQRIKEIINPS